MNYFNAADWLNALDMKGFSPSIRRAVSRNITRPSGHTISFSYFPDPPTFIRSPPLLTDSIRG